MPLERLFYVVRVALRALLRRTRVEREIDEELRYHIAQETEARLSKGVPPAEARRQALVTLGGVESTKARVREARPGASLEQLLQDIRYGLRMLRGNPGFAAAAVLTLTLGVGATTTIFSVVDAVLLQPPPFPDPDRLITLWQTDPTNGNQPAEVAPANFLDWRERAQSFEHMAAVEPWAFDFTGEGEPEVFFASLVSEGFFEALGVSATHGRTFLPGEFRPGNQGVVVLTDGLWRRRFGGDLGIVGQALTLDAQPYTVIGVLAPHFELGLDSSGGEHGVFAPKVFAEHETRTRGGGWWHAIGRIRSDVTLEQAQAELDTIAIALALEHPRTNTDVGARLVPLHTRQVGEVRPALLLLWGAVVFVLLIACVNVANLMLARCTRREQEFAIRTALGGGRGRLLRQLLTESVVVAALGGIGGVLLTAYAVDIVVALAPADVPRLDEITVDARLLGFTTLLVAVTAVGFGLAPAVQTLRQDVNGALNQGRRAGATVAPHRFRSVLVAAEVALALVLLVGAGLLVQSFARLVNVDPGFVPQNTVALQVFAWDRHDGGAARANFFRETIRDIGALPGVEAVGAVSSFPLGLADVTIESSLTIQNRPPPPPGEEPSVTVSIATPRYFETMRIPLKHGRWFDERDDGERPAVAVINETLARRHWADADPVNERIAVRWQGQTVEAEIVGVVGAVRPRGFDSRPRPEVFLPHGQQPFGSMTYVVRTAGEPTSTLSAIKDAVWAVDPLQTFYSVATVEQLMRSTLATRRLTTVLLALFGLVALMLAAIGIYGVIAVATSQRTHEIGLRIALGAQRRDILWMVVSGAVGLASSGVVLGLLAALWLSRSLTSLLFEIAPTDIATFATVSLLLLVVAATAAYIPARRATRLDPLAAIRGA